MKKFIAFLFCIFLLLLSVMVVSAKEVPIVGTSKESFDSNVIDIPIEISNNTGIMGYKLDLEIDNGEFYEVNQGSSFSSGMFNSNITNENKKCSVIWTNDEEIKKDGTLFIVTVTIKDEKKDVKINLSYSKSDTFGKDLEEMDLGCKNIILVPLSSMPTEKKNTKYDNQDEEEFILNYINEVDSKDISKIYSDALKKVAVDDINQMTDEQKELFIDEFNEGVLKYTNGVEKIDKKDLDKSISLINEIVDCCKEYTIKSFKSPTIEEEIDSTIDQLDNSNIPLIWIVIIGVAFAIIISLIIYYIAKKKGGKMNEEE